MAAVSRSSFGALPADLHEIGEVGLHRVLGGEGPFSLRVHVEGQVMDLVVPLLKQGQVFRRQPMSSRKIDVG